MWKLSLWTLQNIPRDAVKKLASSHHKDYIRDEISSLFDKDKKDGIVDYKISSDHFKEIKNTLYDMQWYIDLCKKHAIDISYELLKSFVWLCRNTEEFEILCKSNDIRDILCGDEEGERWQELNIRYLVWLCKTIEEFIWLCTEDNILHVLYNWNSISLEYIVLLCKNIEDFQHLCKNSEFVNMMLYADDANVKRIINLCKTIEEFKELCSKTEAVDIMSYWDKTSIDYIFNLYEIKTAQKFKELSLKRYIISFLQLWKQKNLTLIRKLFDSMNHQEQIQNYLEKIIFPSKDNIRILFESNFDTTSKNSRQLFEYYLQYKPKHLIKMVEMLSTIQYFDLDISLDQFKTLDDFRYKEWVIQQDKLRENFIKILQLNGVDQKNIQKNCSTFDKLLQYNNEQWLEKLLMENLIVYIDRVYHHKLKTALLYHIQSNLTYAESSNIDFNSIDAKKYENNDFLEVCKMSWNPEYNKHQINKLLMNYLLWKFDVIEDMNQYDTPKNKNWLENNLNDEQQKIRLSNNRQEFIVDDKHWEDDWKENIKIRLHNHMEIAKNKINEFNELWYDFIIEFSSPWSLVEYYNTIIKKESSGLKEKNESLFADLKLQIDEIQWLFQTYKSKKVNKVIIERELNPLKSLMMWNRVDWSCLSFYSTVWNYYSAISNTIDVNKWVYYLRDEHGTLLWRCLITIGNDKKLSRYKMYYNGNVDGPLDDYFDNYTTQLAHDMRLQLNGDEDTVINIECEEWYKDGVQQVIQEK